MSKVRSTPNYIVVGTVSKEIHDSKKNPIPTLTDNSMLRLFTLMLNYIIYFICKLFDVFIDLHFSFYV